MLNVFFLKRPKQVPKPVIDPTLRKYGIYLRNSGYCQMILEAIIETDLQTVIWERNTPDRSHCRDILLSFFSLHALYTF